jgi:hypothetical protein
MQGVPGTFWVKNGKTIKMAGITVITAVLHYTFLLDL